MTTVVVLLVVAVGCIAAGLLVSWIIERREAAERSLPPLFFPLAPSPPLHKPTPPVQMSAPPVQTNGNGNGAAHRRESPVNSNGVALGRETPVYRRSTTVERPRMNLPHPPAPPRRDAYDSSDTVRFVRQTDQAVQLLPGRLEVLEGPTPHREIRFVRIPGEPPQVFLGRDAGLSPQYVGLGSATVSRRHARFDYADNRWSVKNLSRTNPLVVNDDEVLETDAPRPLVDGDCLELGDVVLRFHAH